MKLIFPLFALCLIASTTSFIASATSHLTIEELRVAKAQQAMPMLKNYFNWSAFKGDWSTVSDFALAQRTMNQIGD